MVFRAWPEEERGSVFWVYVAAQACRRISFDLRVYARPSSGSSGEDGVGRWWDQPRGLTCRCAENGRRTNLIRMLKQGNTTTTHVGRHGLAAGVVCAGRDNYRGLHCCAARALNTRRVQWCTVVGALARTLVGSMLVATCDPSGHLHQPTLPGPAVYDVGAANCLASPTKSQVDQCL